jgi:hypothetical protein
MSNPNVENLLRIPGYLVAAPTNLATTFPYGGTAIGTYSRVDFGMVQLSFAISGEEYGGQVVERIYAGQQPRLYATLETFDKDALSRFFPGYVAGLQQGPTLALDVNGSARAGSRIGASLGAALLFAPESPDGPAPWLLSRRAVPNIEESIRIAQRVNVRFGIPLVWDLTPDANGKCYEYGQRREIAV